MPFFREAKHSESAPSKTLQCLLEEYHGVIPMLVRDNEPESTPHTHDTGHKDAAIMKNTDSSRNIAYLLPGGTGTDRTIYACCSHSECSILLMNLGKRRNLVYQNETEVQYYVKGALNDALAALGLSDEMMVRPEISLFSYRPDIIVVTHSSFGTIMVVEVKKPGIDVFTSQSVGGQVYDYLVGMLTMGISCPFAVLTTYEQMVIAHLDDDGRSKELFKRVADNMGHDLKQEIEFLKQAGQKEEEHKATRTPSVSTESCCFSY